MDLGTVLSVAQALFAALQCSELRDFCSILGYKSELEKLERTVRIVKAVLEEAESKEELPPQAQLYIDDLKDAIYDADDLLDEFVTLAQRKKDLIKEGKISEKLHLLFSRFNPLATAHKMSKGVKEIRERLDEIASEHTKFGFKLDNKPILRRREETCSYVDVKGIIGREDEVEQIVGRLLDHDVCRDVCCLAIVGLGGLGKTALAQVVFQDPRVVKGFDLRVWTCVSDQDQKTLDVKGVLCKILHSLTDGKDRDMNMESLLRQLRDKLVGKRFLIVLDDVWSEDRRRLLDLANYLMVGLRGSWIMVTTRSEMTANILGKELVHILKGLSEKDSWHLFEITAFGEHEQPNSLDLVKIGQEVVKKCAYVPLAIKVVGSLLFGQSKEKWISFQKKGLGRLKYGDNNDIQSILKFSYDQLDSPLKTCFSFCALFPKDYVIRKDLLLDLWMANDFVVPEECQSVQDAGEEYFSILVRRCFFQDIFKDEYGEIESCKIHDLMHDIAQEVTGKEICVLDSSATKLDSSKVRHLSYSSLGKDTQSCFSQGKIRTCFRISEKQDACIPVDNLLTNWRCLRVLDLSNLRIKHLPSSLGKLLHLRYLDLSWNVELEMLPNSITKLYNLQVIKLNNSNKLKELPKDLSKLVKLRVLDIDAFVSELTGMPRGIGKLSCLQKLSLFVLGDNNSTSKRSIVDQMEDLKSLTSLRGSLKIKIKQNTEYVAENAGQRGYIQNIELLNRVDFVFTHMDWEQGLLLEDLKPPHKLRELILEGYGGMRMPSWAVEDNLTASLPNLVELTLSRCPRLVHLPSLRRMCNLKFLWFADLDELEYIEDRSSESEIFFPSLKEVSLFAMKKLKGWWREGEMVDDVSQKPSFPCLSGLVIHGCPKLTSIPPCPTVEELLLYGIDENLELKRSTESGNSKLRYLQTNNLGCLRSMLPLLVPIKIQLHSNDKVETLSEFGETLRSCSSYLRNLTIFYCSSLKSVSGLEHLTCLESLDLIRLSSLSLSEEGEGDDGMPWRCLAHSLHSLKLYDLPKVVRLPNGMRHLTALQSLTIDYCKNLESVPEWMPELTSLETLEISRCSESLYDRCRNPTGEDWPYIQHIPNFILSVLNGELLGNRQGKVRRIWRLPRSMNGIDPYINTANLKLCSNVFIREIGVGIDSVEYGT